MTNFTIQLNWQRATMDFNYKTYNRNHTVTFTGGDAINMSAAPDYFGDVKLANPEELLIAALSSCHMLTFLALAANKNIIINRYLDNAKGTLGKNAAGKMAILEISLVPEITFSSIMNEAEQVLHELFEKAHTHCFIANSINSKVEMKPTFIKI